MTLSEIAIMESDEFRRAVEENIDRDPVRVALDGSIAHPALVATQVKYLQRARTKLPSWYRARAIIPPRAFEQSSGEAAAGHKDYAGDVCVDLTCGLGVDSLHLAHGFGRVVAVERDEALAWAARVNFARMGTTNIEVVNSSAEEYLAAMEARGESADLIYVDPDRRDDTGRKLVRLEDCSPDIVALLPRMRALAGRLVVKCSPLFDVDEALRIFGPGCRVEVVSQGGECKEVLVETGGGLTSPTVAATSLGIGTVEFPAGMPTRPASENVAEIPSETPAGISANTDYGTPEAFRYLIIPDVALRKARVVRRYFAQRLPGAVVPNPEGYVFIDSQPETGPILGRIFEVIRMERYDPSSLRKELRREGVTGIDIYTHGFPAGSGEIARRLGVREGGTRKIAFTKIDGTLWQITMR